MTGVSRPLTAWRFTPCCGVSIGAPINVADGDSIVLVCSRCKQRFEAVFGPKDDTARDVLKEHAHWTQEGAAACKLCAELQARATLAELSRSAAGFRHADPNCTGTPRKITGDVHAWWCDACGQLETIHSV